MGWTEAANSSISRALTGDRRQDRDRTSNAFLMPDGATQRSCWEFGATRRRWKMGEVFEREKAARTGFSVSASASSQPSSGIAPAARRVVEVAVSSRGGGCHADGTTSVLDDSPLGIDRLARSWCSNTQAEKGEVHYLADAVNP